MTIFIITHQAGFEVDPVIDRLKSLKLPFVRFNQDDGDNISKVGFLRSDSKENIFWTSDNKSVSLTNVGCAWFQQPPPFTGQPDNFEQAVQRNNLIAFLEATFDFLPVKWLNRVANARRAANKVLQLHLAPSVGLAVPNTCISNDPLTVRSFCSKGPSIVKNLNSSWIAQENDAVVSSTKFVQDDYIKDDQAIIFCPLIYQQFIERRYDYRVVILGDATFVSRCDSTLGDPADVRVDNKTVANFYRDKIPPEYIEKLGIQLFPGPRPCFYARPENGLSRKVRFVDMCS